MAIDAPIGSSNLPLLRVHELSKKYSRGGLWRRRSPVTGVASVGFEIFPTTTLGLVGSSGSGKSTVARCVGGLERPDAGEVWLEDVEISRLSNRELRRFRPAVQMIFQDSATAMNPRFTVAEVIQEPLLIQARGNPNERRGQALAVMEEVGLPAKWARRPALDLSGGQRQRLAIARALALHPRLLILDEALSALDLSTQAQMVNLLLDLQAAHSLTYLFISHDLGLVAQVADHIAVMSAGEIVEQGPAAAILKSPHQDETKALLACAQKSQSALTAARGASV